MKKLLILTLAFLSLSSAGAIAQSLNPDRAERENFLVETKEFLQKYVLPDIEKEIEIYTKAGLPPPPELTEILTIGRNAETVENLETFDRTVRHYMENGPTLPSLTEEQVRTIAEGFGDILKRMAGSGIETEDIQKLLDEAKTKDDIQRFFSAMTSLVSPPALSPQGEPVAPSLVVTGQEEGADSPPQASKNTESEESEEVDEPLPSEALPARPEADSDGAKEGEPLPPVDLSDLGSFEEIKETMQSYTSALSQAGAPVREIDRRIREATVTEDLLSLTPDLSALARAFPFGTLSPEELLEASEAELRLLQSNVAHLLTVSPLALTEVASKLHSLEAEVLLLEGEPSEEENGKSVELFLSHLRATLQEIFGFSPDPLQQPPLEELRGEMHTILSDLRDLLSTSVTDAEDRTLLEDAFRALEVGEDEFSTLAEMEQWFRTNEQHIGVIRRVLPSPSLSEVQQDLLTVIESLGLHLASLDDTPVNMEVLQAGLQELRSSLASLTTETELDSWFKSFDAYFTSLTSDEI